jgi:hypothetical protein
MSVYGTPVPSLGTAKSAAPGETADTTAGQGVLKIAGFDAERTLKSLRANGPAF